MATISIVNEIENETWATTYGYRWTCKGYLANKNIHHGVDQHKHNRVPWNCYHGV